MVSLTLGLLRDPESKLLLPGVIVGERGSTVNLVPSLNVKLTILGGHNSTDLGVHVLPKMGRALCTTLTCARLELLKFDFGPLSAGHGRIGNKEDTRVNLEYTHDIMKFAAEAAAEVTREQLQTAGVDRVNDPTALQFGNAQWALMTIGDLRGDGCARRLVRKWGCARLGALKFSQGIIARRHLLFDSTDTE